MTVIEFFTAQPLLAQPPATTDDSVWFYRMNPFTRSRLSQPDLVAAVDAVFAAERDVEHTAAEAGAVLHQMIGDAEDAADRKALLATSRALRKGKRLPIDPELLEVHTWETAVCAHDEALADLREVYVQVLVRERQELARQLTDPHLKASLELVSPQIARQADRYTQAVSSDGTAPSRLLKSERGLIQYVTRAAVRTSPLSQLTAVGLTHAEPGGSHLNDPILTGERSVCSLHRVMFDYVVGGALQADGALPQDPHVSIPPTGAVYGDRLFVLRLSKQGWDRIGVPLRPPLNHIINALQMGSAPLSEVVTYLQRELGLGREKLESIVRQAAAGGLVCFLSPSTDADVLDLDTRASETLERVLPEVAEGLQRLAVTPAEGRRRILDGLDTVLGDLSRVASRPSRISVTEDRLVEVAPIDPLSWGSALNDLGPAVDLLAAFDWLADVAVILNDAFVTRHGLGARVPLVAASLALVADVKQAVERMGEVYAVAAEDPFAFDSSGGPDSTLARLYASRRGIEEAVGQAVQNALDHDHEEVVIDPLHVEVLLSQMPAQVRERPGGYGVLTQSLGDRLVINDGLPGHGMLYSRFLGPDRDGGGDTINRMRKGLLRRYAEPGSTLVEDRSHHGLNVNVHPRVLDDTLEPHDWHRLELQHDVATDRLAVFDGSERIKVIPIGGGHPGLYPPPLSVASSLVIAGRLFNGLPDAWAAGDVRDQTSTRRIPRVLVGDVVISRARWYPGTQLTEALALTEETDRFLALTRWRTEHGIPREVVIKTAPDDTGPAAVNNPGAEPDRSKAKPQYVDLGSALCVRVLPRMLERRSGEEGPTLYFEEAAPGVLDGTHATEWVVEINRRPGGSYSYGGEK